MVTVNATQDLLRFGVFELNLATEELRKSGTLLKLAPHPFKVLTLLASRSGQVVSREEIQQKLWGDETYVDFEQGLNHCIKQIRNALSDSAETPLYVETVPRRGYRFLAPVVSKTILAPAPRVVESTSGIQSGIRMPAIASPMPPAAPAPTAVIPAPGLSIANPVSAKTEPPTAEPAAATETTVPMKTVRGIGRRAIWIGCMVAAGLIIAVIGILYWRSRNSAVLTEKDSIVLADFDNTTGETVFDTALKQALSVGLEQSPFLSVLSDQKVNEQLRFMGLPADARLTPDVVRQVCQRAGSKAVLEGSISGVGGHYVIGLKAIDCNTGDSLDSAQAEASNRGRVLGALDKAARKMREELGESLATAQKYDTPVEQATTPSLDALKAYSLGIKAGNAQGYAAAIPYLKNAIDLDPNFAMAYARLGVEYSNLSQPDLAAEYITKAFRMRDRTSEREKLYIISLYHDLVTGDTDQAIAAYQLLQQAYPREAASYMNLNSLYNATGRYDQALIEAQNALQIDPSRVVNYLNLAVTYLDLNRLEEAQKVLEEAKARELADPALLAVAYELAFLRGDAAAMAQQVAAAGGSPGVQDQFFALQSDTESYFGRLSKARGLSQSAEESARRAGAKETAALWQLAGALHEAELGDAKRARQEAEEALAASSGKNVEILAALALARSGDGKRAESLASSLSKQFPFDTLLNNYWVPTIRAAIALEAKDSSTAIEALRPTTAYETGSPSPGIAFFYPVYLRGLAYLQAGQSLQAAAEFRKMLNYPGVVLNLPIGALAYLQLARAQAMSDDSAAARQSYQKFLELWKDADPNSRILAQAKAEYSQRF